jgi:hypothetical protein
MRYCPIIADVEEVMVHTSTRHKIELERLGVIYIMQGVFELYLDVYEKEIFEERRLLLPYQRYLENLMNTYWTIVDLTCGAYFNAAQMLRIIFENALQTLYVLSLCNDYNDQIKMVDEGFTIKDKKVRGFSYQIIDKVSAKYAWFDREVQEKAKSLYGKLSGMAHASAHHLKEIHDIKHNMRMYFFSYDEQEFSLLLELFEEVIEFNLAFLAQIFPKAFNTFIKEIPSRDKEVLPLNLAKKANE